MHGGKRVRPLRHWESNDVSARVRLGSGAVGRVHEACAGSQGTEDDGHVDNKEDDGECSQFPPRAADSEGPDDATDRRENDEVTKPRPLDPPKRLMKQQLWAGKPDAVVVRIGRRPTCSQIIHPPASCASARCVASISPGPTDLAAARTDGRHRVRWSLGCGHSPTSGRSRPWRTSAACVERSEPRRHRGFGHASVLAARCQAAWVCSATGP